MKVIFLDVDGVLNNADTKDRSPSGYKGVSGEMIRNLREIVRKTGAQIILSSDWRLIRDDKVHGKDYRYLVRKLRFIGGLKLSGHTDDISWRYRGTDKRRTDKESILKKRETCQMKSILIKDTTREEREKIVLESIGNISGSCDGCAAGLADMYQDYIDGKREIHDINMLRSPEEWAAYTPEQEKAFIRANYDNQNNLLIDGYDTVGISKPMQE